MDANTLAEIKRRYSRRLDGFFVYVAPEHFTALLAAAEELARLREALKCYGSHRWNCERRAWLADNPRVRARYQELPPCDCGLAAALSEEAR
jgi:hypothetical protein